MSVRLIEADAYRRALSVRDLTDAALGPHAMQRLVHDTAAALQARWRCPVILYRSSPLVSVADNYDALGYAPDGASRDARYTRYVAHDRLLRTQMSALVPGALRTLAAADYDDVLIACPGLTYRRDAIDRLHVGEPHQLDLWRVTRQPLDRSALEEMIAIVGDALLPGTPLRSDPTQHPYTLDGLEVHASVKGRWVEILECGLAHPRVLEAAGSNTGGGLAMCIGLDRALMLRKGIDDIRLLRSQDPRIASQMLNLGPYRPVSSQPAIQRDMSIAVQNDVTPEEIGDRVRDIVGARADSLESVEVLTQTPHSALPAAARDRLGIAAGQKNVLLRLVIRDLTRTLTAAEANALRDEVYGALHEGSVKTWARDS
jgi:phenylalanyl-tRNA synthetase alpha chain